MKIMPKLNTLGDIKKQQVRAQKAAQKALQQAKEAKALQEALEKQRADELMTQEIARKVARSIIGQRKFVTVQVNSGKDFSAREAIQGYSGRLSSTESDWAPWSINFKK